MKARSAALGFDACGVAAAGPADPHNHLGEWLDRGFSADMDWLARTRNIRQDVQRRLPGARSVVVVARNYYSPRPEALPNTGHVSRYAWGRDYHKVLRKPLRALARFIVELDPRAMCYCSVDTGPVLERTWAARAGIGWIGKNGLVIRTDVGSWLFLGVILTTAEFEPDTSAADRCGSCTRCIEACPTGAIVGPRMVDSRRCISYHTVENRGQIPPDLGAKFGRWVFGCDVCQEVCPWNRFAKLTSEKEFHPRQGVANPDLHEILRMEPHAFLQTFSGTPVLRAKLDGMQRNARIALENQV